MCFRNLPRMFSKIHEQANKNPSVSHFRSNDVPIVYLSIKVVQDFKFLSNLCISSLFFSKISCRANLTSPFKLESFSKFSSANPFFNILNIFLALLYGNLPYLYGDLFGQTNDIKGKYLFFVPSKLGALKKNLSLFKDYLLLPRSNMQCIFF